MKELEIQSVNDCPIYKAIVKGGNTMELEAYFIARKDWKDIINN